MLQLLRVWSPLPEDPVIAAFSVLHDAPIVIGDRGTAAVGKERLSKACRDAANTVRVPAQKQRDPRLQGCTAGCAMQDTPSIRPIVPGCCADRAVQGMPKAAAAPAEAIAGAVRSIALGVRNGVDPERYEEQLLNRTSRGTNRQLCGVGLQPSSCSWRCRLADSPVSSARALLLLYGKRSRGM